MKSFEYWTAEALELTFGIQKVDSHPALDEWLAAEMPISTEEKVRLEADRAELHEKAEFWNEDEIKFFFISDIVRMVNFGKRGVYSIFSQRMIKATLTDVNNQKIDMRGRVELLVALGIQTPRQPYFFIHDYKPQLRGSNDPRGRLLAAMLTTSHLNQPKITQYGIYVLGKWWHFVVLAGSEYALSESFDATKSADLHRIFSMLKWCKKEIEKRLPAKNDLASAKF